MKERKKCIGYIGKPINGSLFIEKCNKFGYNGSNVCKHHSYYLDFTDDQLNKIKEWDEAKIPGDTIGFCKRCKRFIFDEEHDNDVFPRCNKCLEAGRKEREQKREKQQATKELKRCPWYNKYGKPCIKFKKENGYCNFHQYVTKYSSEQKNGKLGSCPDCHLWVNQDEYLTCEK